MCEKVVYVHPGLSSFAEKDIAILKQSFDVTTVYFPVLKKWSIPVHLLRQMFYLLRQSKRNTIVVSQFAGFHTLIPSLIGSFTRLRTVIVLGGTDCVAFPSIGYGNFSRSLLGNVTGFSMRHADLLLPVHESLIRYAYTYQDEDGPEQGYLAHRPSIATPVQTIYNGYDDTAWQNTDQEREPRSFVTIGAGLTTYFARKLKGIDLIIEMAHQHSDCRFYIVGGKGLAIDQLPENLLLLDKIPNNELNTFLQQKEFYLQLSMSEGFPNALCEAMLSGCIPIVSAVGAMPFIVENSGFILQRKSAGDLSALLMKALDTASDDRKHRSAKAHQLIKERFPLVLRTTQLTNSILALKKR